MMRKTLTGNVQPAYFNIDCLVIQQNLSNSIYRTSTALKEALENSGYDVTYTHSKERFRTSANIHDDIRKEIREADEQQLDEIICMMRNIDSQYVTISH